MPNRKLLIKFCLIISFITILACTLRWDVFTHPRSFSDNTVTSAVQAQSTVAKKRFEVRGASLMIPDDMESIEPFGDDVRYREAFRNADFSITIATDLLSPELLKESQKQSLLSCETPRSVAENPFYHESSIQIDGRKAKLGVTKAASARQLNADLCFPSSGDSSYPLRIFAICKDERALEMALQVFRSITFKRQR